MSRGAFDPRVPPARRTPAARLAWAVLAALAGGNASRSDTGLFNYEGDSLPGARGSGWIIANACDGDCSGYLDGGRYVAQFVIGGGSIYYHHHWIAYPPQPQPRNLFVEVRLRTNSIYLPGWYGDDCYVSAQVQSVSDPIWIHGDRVFSFSGNFSVGGLSPADFRVYRFESLDGHHWTWAVDGLVFYNGYVAGNAIGSAFVQFGGIGGDLNLYPGLRNEWDFVRLGTISFGETVLSSDPPNGYVDPRQDAVAGSPAMLQGITRFTVTFNQPNGLYINQVTVQSTAPAALRPNVQWVTRPEGEMGGTTWEIRLDKRIPPGHRTRFVISDVAQAAQYGQTGATSVVEYAFLPVDVNANGTSTGQDVIALVIAVNGSSTNLLRHDINRNGAVTGQDVLRLVQLLNGADTSQAWNGVSLPPWP